MGCLVILCSLCIIYIGCHNHNTNYSKIIDEWKGKVIQLPLQIDWKTMGKDTTCPALLEPPNKILVYLDSTGCTPCKFQISKWQALIDTCHQKQIHVSFLFIIHSSNYDELSVNLITHNFSYPMIYDIENRFNKLNHFSKDPTLHVFLLDKDNKIQLIGSPINNPKMWELYKKTIAQSK